MKVKISEIPETGLTMHEQLDPVETGLETQDLRFTRPLDVCATFQRQREIVLVEVDVAGQTEQVCARCLEHRSQAYGGDFHFGYPVERILELDITDDIRQEILLSYPVRYLCREDCQGLCPQCGANRNERSCSHGSS